MKHNPLVVKIGGSTLGSQDTTLEDLVALQRQGALPIVVHGGGKTITEWLARQGVPTRFVRGLRVTDEQSLQVVVAVLAGLVNKQLVAQIWALGGKAMGLSGADGGFIRAQIQDPELGLVGEVSSVNLEPLRVVLEAGFIPVVAPISLQEGNGATQRGTLLNLNADTVAGELACALGASRLIFLTDVPGVQDKEGRILSRLTPQEAQNLLAAEIASGGMVPKLEACVRALACVVSAHILDGRKPHALLEGLSHGVGTTIQKGQVK